MCKVLDQGTLHGRQAGKELLGSGTAVTVIGAPIGFLPLSGLVGCPSCCTLLAALTKSGDVLLEAPKGLHVEPGLLGLCEGVIEEFWDLLEGHLGEEVPGGLNLLGGDIRDVPDRPAGALLDEEIGDPEGLRDRLLVIMEFELNSALVTASIEAIVIGKELLPRPEGDDEAFPRLGLLNRIGGKEPYTNELAQM